MYNEFDKEEFMLDEEEMGDPKKSGIFADENEDDEPADGDLEDDGDEDDDEDLPPPVEEEI